MRRCECERRSFYKAIKAEALDERAEVRGVVESSPKHASRRHARSNESILVAFRSHAFIADARAWLCPLGAPPSSSVPGTAIVKPLTLLRRIINLSITTHVPRSFDFPDLSRGEAFSPACRGTFTCFLVQFSRVERNPRERSDEEPRIPGLRNCWVSGSRQLGDHRNVSPKCQLRSLCP